MINYKSFKEKLLQEEYSNYSEQAIEKLYVILSRFDPIEFDNYDRWWEIVYYWTEQKENEINGLTDKDFVENINGALAYRLSNGNILYFNG